MKKKTNRSFRKRLIRSAGLILLGGISCLLCSPWWLRPHRPLSNAQALIIEGYLADSNVGPVAAYLQAHPQLKVLTTGANLSSMVFKTHQPGKLFWRFSDTALFQPLNSSRPNIRLKGHSKGCNEQACIWTVAVDGDTLFDGEMANYQAQSWQYHSRSPARPLQEIAITFGHPQPDSSCH